MRVIICGAGQVGYAVAAYLAGEAHDVTVVDSDPALVARMNDRLEVNGIVGHGSSPDVLDAAGAADADLLLAVTHADEVNMVACQVGHSLFGVPKKIARVRRAAYLDPAWSNLFSRAHMPIDALISPEVTVAQDIERRLAIPGTSLVVPLAGGAAYALGVVCRDDCPLLHTPLDQIRALFPDLAFNILAVSHAGRPMPAHADGQILAGDVAYFVVDARHIRRVLDAFGRRDAASRRVMIAGGGSIGAALAHRLQGSGVVDYDLTIVEADPDRAQALGAEFSDLIILHGSSLERHILEEASIQSVDTVVAVTNSDETNILASLLAKQCGAERAMALVAGPSYAPLVGLLGLDAMISPRATIITQIMGYLRRGNIRAIHTLREGFAEVMEAAVGESSPLAGHGPGDAPLPAGVTLAAVVRGGGGEDAGAAQVLMPAQGLVVRPGDTAVLMVPQGRAREAEKTLMVQVNLF